MCGNRDSRLGQFCRDRAAVLRELALLFIDTPEKGGLFRRVLLSVTASVKVGRP